MHQNCFWFCAACIHGCFSTGLGFLPCWGFAFSHLVCQFQSGYVEAYFTILGFQLLPFTGSILVVYCTVAHFPFRILCITGKILTIFFMIFLYLKKCFSELKNNPAFISCVLKIQIQVWVASALFLFFSSSLMESPINLLAATWAT